MPIGLKVVKQLIKERKIKKIGKGNIKQIFIQEIGLYTKLSLARKDKILFKKACMNNIIITYLKLFINSQKIYQINISLPLISFNP